MNSATFEELECQHQKQFEDIELQFTPALLVSVTLLRFRNVSVDGISDFLDTPDPQIEVSCPQSKPPNTFKTRNIKDNVTKGELHVEFKFVIPPERNPNKDLDIEIQLYDRDVIIDRKIGKQVVDISAYDIDDKPKYKSLKFGVNNGDVDIKFKKQMRTSPDFRYSFGLCPEEMEFRQKRIPFVCQAMKKLFGGDGPQGPAETPVVSLVGSGGGFRAVVGMCGAMEALGDAGLLDTITYNCGLSGSAWYLSAGYALQGLAASKQKAFHNGLRKRFRKNVLWQFLNVKTLCSYKDSVADKLKKYNLPHTFVNFFPGYLIGKQLLGKSKLNTRLSDLAPYVETGKVPYPVLVALHVKNKKPADQFHAYVERTPHEIYIPSYGVGLKPVNEGSVWSNGFLARMHPEYPLHFTIGMTGCAFCILLSQYIIEGGECGADLAEYLDNLRVNGRRLAKRAIKGTKKVMQIDFDSSDDSDMDDDDKPDSSATSDHHFDSDDASSISPELAQLARNSSLQAAAMAAYATTAPAVMPDVSETPTLIKLLRNSQLLTSRNAYIGRTARLHNFVLNCEKMKRYPLNPLGKFCSFISEEQKQLVKVVGHKCTNHKLSLSTKLKFMSFADAGILKNVPTDAALRPQRGTDVMIVMDFNLYESDVKFDYRPILTAAAHCCQSGIKFPKIDLKKLLDNPSEELHVFPSDKDDCPTVLWFTLSNRRFKNLKDYVPKSNTKKPWTDRGAFNDFPVFDNGTKYGTFRFRYKEYDFDQLRELMYFNVSSHIEEIKEALINATERKRRRQGLGGGQSSSSTLANTQTT